MSSPKSELRQVCLAVEPPPPPPPPPSHSIPLYFVCINNFTRTPMLTKAKLEPSRNDEMSPALLRSHDPLEPSRNDEMSPALPLYCSWKCTNACGGHLLVK